jgi:hypothetical protein
MTSLTVNGLSINKAIEAKITNENIANISLNEVICSAYFLIFVKSPAISLEPTVFNPKLTIIEKKARNELAKLIIP